MVNGRMLVMLGVVLGGLSLAGAGEPTTGPATAPVAAPGAAGRLPFIEVDLPHKRVRVECQMVKADYALEFFCVRAGTNEYEAVIASNVKPSHLHLALLMLGLEPGQTLKYSADTDTWTPPSGPALNVSVEWMKGGQLVREPAYRLLRSIRTKKEAPAMGWVFAGSRVAGDRYVADLSGYLVSVVNVEGMVVDVSGRVSKSMEEREWETNWEVAPEPGTKLWMVIEPVLEPKK